MARFERAATVALALGAAAAVVACNELLGLGDYVEVACTTKCPDGAPPISDASNDAPDAPARLPEAGEGGGAVDAGLPELKYTWPQWHMPNPVEAGLANDASYSVIGDASVIDNVTKLEWEKASARVSSFDDASRRCASIATNGHADWRVPTRIELVSLLDYMRSDPPQIDPVFDQQPASLWSASRYAGDAGLHWTVDFFFGEVKSGTATEVRCVRGPGA